MVQEVLSYLELAGGPLYIKHKIELIKVFKGSIYDPR